MKFYQAIHRSLDDTSEVHLLLVHNLLKLWLEDQRNGAYEANGQAFATLILLHIAPQELPESVFYDGFDAGFSNIGFEEWGE